MPLAGVCYHCVVRTNGTWWESTSVYAYNPHHVASEVLWCLFGFYCHCAARVEEKEAEPGNTLSRHNRD
jgi:hypothetical protein